MCLFDLLGLQLSPRIRDLGKITLYRAGPTLQAVEAALRDLNPVPQERGDTFIGPLARRLGIRPATLRKWERAGLVQPRRDPQTGYRVYSAADVSDALQVQ